VAGKRPLARHSRRRGAVIPRGRHDDVVDCLSDAVAEVTAGAGTPARVYTMATSDTGPLELAVDQHGVGEGLTGGEIADVTRLRAHRRGDRDCCR
jgi:hypothetical protein